MPQLTTITLPSCKTSISQLELFVNNVARRHNICQDKFPDILISLTEAVTNAIVHGNKLDIRKRVIITMQKTESCIKFEVSDEGAGFNPHTLPDPTLPENIACCGGRGVYLIKKLADQVHFEENGSKVQIRFHV